MKRLIPDWPTRVVVGWLLILTGLFYLCLLVGCTVFRVKNADGSIMYQVGAPLVTRNTASIWTHEWIDKENVLHEVKVIHNLDENTNNQLEMLKLLAEYAKQAGAAAATGSP